MRATLAVLCLTLWGCGGESSEPAADGAPRAAGSAIPVVDAEGILAALAARRGQPLLVNFWARWCTPCVAELPDLVTVGRALRRDGGEILGFAMDLWAPGYELEESRRALPGFLRDHDVDYPVFLYGSTDPIPVIERLEIPGDLPVTLAIDREGRIVRIQAGKATPEELAELARLARGA